MPKLSENLICEISQLRNEPQWLLDWRLSAYKAWQKMTAPNWAELKIPEINYDELNYYNAPTEIDNSDLEKIYDKYEQVLNNSLFLNVPHKF